MHHPMDFLLPLEDQCYDCTLVLRLPAKRKAERLEEGAWSSPATRGQRVSKRRRVLIDSAQQEPLPSKSLSSEQLELQRVRLPTYSLLLAGFSEKFRYCALHVVAICASAAHTNRQMLTPQGLDGTLVRC